MRQTKIRSPRGTTARTGRRTSRGRARQAPSSQEALLTPRQVREIGGVACVVAGLLAIVAVLWSRGTGLSSLGDLLVTGFGAGWWIPALAALGIGVLVLWPQPLPVRWLDLVAIVIGIGAILGLLSVLARAGGSTGKAMAGAFGFAGLAGTVILLLAILVVCLIVAFHFSPGVAVLKLAAAFQAANAERVRLNALLRPQGKVSAGQAVLSVEGPRPSPATAEIEAPAPKPVAAVAVPPPVGLETEPAIPESEDLDPDLMSLRAPVEHDGHQELFRVVADIEADEPEIDWKLPPLSLLDSVTARKEKMADEIKRNVKIIEGTLATFGVQARVIGVNSGPAVTQYELQPAAGVPVKRIVSLQNDLALALAASPLRIEAPIPGKSAVGIEVPNKSASLVSIREVVETANFRSSTRNLALALGNDVSGQPIVGDLTRMPHLLIAGATGQGKSVCINVLISSLLFQATPAQLKLVMIDPKRVELSAYNELPHLAVPVIVEAHQASAALRWAVAEMDRRYRLLASEGVRSIQSYNEKARVQSARPLPYIVIVVDELADLMMVAAGEIEELVCRIAQLARAVGIHLVIATQRPSTDIITGLIKANIPSRIAFAVSSQVDSRVILDSVGAEKLLGRGDMLYQPVDAGKPSRIQGALVSDSEVENLVGFWKAQGGPRYMEEVLIDGPTPVVGGGSDRKLDPLFARSARAVAAEGAASVSLIQRKFNVGYSRAGRIVDQLAEHRVIGTYQGSKSREVLMNLPDVDELMESLGLEGGQ